MTTPEPIGPHDEAIDALAVQLGRIAQALRAPYLPELRLARIQIAYEGAFEALLDTYEDLQRARDGRPPRAPQEAVPAVTQSTRGAARTTSTGVELRSL
ncbi:hypothetical protein ACFXJ5_16995 [Streptomyces sp. NPDC059373]